MNVLKILKVDRKKLSVPLLIWLVAAASAAALLLWTISGSITMGEPFIGYASVAGDDFEKLTDGSTLDVGNFDLYPGDSLEASVSVSNLAATSIAVEIAFVDDGSLSWAVDCSESTSGLAYTFDGSALVMEIPLTNATIGFVGSSSVEDPVGLHDLTLEVSRIAPVSYASSCP